MADPGDPRRYDRHMRRSDHRIPAARHVAADRADRDVAVAEHDPGQRLDLDILHRGALDFRKVADLLLREFGVVDRLRRDLRDQTADLVIREAKARRRPFVEALRQIAHRRIAARLHVGDDRLDRAPGLRVCFFLLPGESGGFDVAGHELSPTR